MSRQELENVNREWRQLWNVVQQKHQLLEEYKEFHPNWLHEVEWANLRGDHELALKAMREFEAKHKRELEEYMRLRHTQLHRRKYTARPAFIPIFVITFLLMILYGPIAAGLFSGFAVILVSVVLAILNRPSR